MAEVVLVHGLWHRSWSMLVLGRHLQAAGLAVRRFDYPSTSEDAAVTAARLAEFCHASSHDQCHIVGHSLGGLMTLNMLQTRDAPPPGHVVMLGTPLQGSAAARQFARLPFLSGWLGRAHETLQAGRAETPVDRPCGMIAGTFAAGMGRLTGLPPGPNDGTVSVEETRAPWLADHLEMNISHTSMLISSAVAAQAAHFLVHGAFKRD